MWREGGDEGVVMRVMRVMKGERLICGDESIVMSMKNFIAIIIKNVIQLIVSCLICWMCRNFKRN